MQLQGDWLHDPALQAVMGCLTEAGHRAYLVGGCVRNALLGAPVSDHDIATDATPDQVIALARAAGFKCIPTGIDHGTVTVIARTIAHEITTFRRDVDTDGRHATVAFSRDIAEDAARRDFTMNALYADAQGRVIDPLGSGLADLQARHLRFVGEPEARIREDFLRILRFFRFTAWYGAPENGPDPEGLAACAALADGIETLARERIGAEMRKLLAAPDPAPAVAAMAATHVLTHVLPGADARALAPLVHLEGLFDQPPEPMRRLAALGGQDVAAALRLSKAEARQLQTLHDAMGAMGSPEVLAYRHGLQPARDAVLILAAMMGMPPEDSFLARTARGATHRLPIGAKDLMPALQGPALGARLKALEAEWIASGFALTRAELLARAQGSDCD